MKIAIFTHNFPSDAKDLNNAGIFVFNIAEELSKKNKVWVFCPHESKHSISKIGKVNVFWFRRGTKNQLGSVNLKNPVGLINLSLFFLRAFTVIPSYIKKTNRPDVCIAMWAWPSGLFALVVKKIYKVPYIIWALGSDINKYSKMPFMGWLIRSILQNADMLYADGIELTKDVENISSENCEFLPSSTKVESIKVNRNNHDKIVISFLGRMESVKGPDILVGALIDIKNKLTDFEINMIGDGSMFDDLKKKIEDNNLEKYITFWNSDRARNMKLIAQSDWIVIPSRGDSIPLIFSEAMKLKVPVLASNLPDISFLLEKYKVGYTFKTENSSDLGRLILTLKKHKTQRETFVKNTSKAAKDFSIEESTKRLYNRLHEIVAHE